MQNVFGAPNRTGHRWGQRLGTRLRNPYNALIAVLVIVGLAVSFMDPRGLIVTVVALLPLAAILRLLHGIRAELREHSRHLKAAADLSYLLVKRDLGAGEEA